MSAYIVGLLVTLAAEPGDTLKGRMLPIYVREAETYSVAVESMPGRRLKLEQEPVFESSNPARSDQHGAMYLWLRDGRPAALAYVFSVTRAMLDGRQIYHELHALDPEKLVVERDEFNQWEPRAGLARKEIPGAAAPAASVGARRLQLRALAREFAGHSIDRDGKRWELRLLPAPLYRYPSAESGVVDGALFAMVSNAGTDPEVILLIEARQVEGATRWEYACGRFTDWELHVHHKDDEVFSSVRSEESPFAHDPLHLYRIFPEKRISPEGKLIARIQQLPNGKPVFIPVEDD